MITNEVKTFQKMQKRETCVGKAWEVGPPWPERCNMARCHSAL